jgi:sugar phosphate isomerase/epimerase
MHFCGSVPKPIGVQLYSLREALAADFEGTVRQVAAMGYAGVETAGFPGTTPEKAAALFRSLGLSVPSAHIPLPLGDKQQEVLDTMAALGARWLVLAYLPPEDFATIDSIKAQCGRINEANEVARAAGLTLVYHNHWWEYQPVDGWYPYQVMAQHLDPTVKFEIDTYWVQTAGKSAVDVVRELDDRVPLLHLKDGPLDTKASMVAVGEGRMDFEPIVQAADSAEWLIVELDRCDTDMLTAVNKSFQFISQKGWGHGKQG